MANRIINPYLQRIIAQQNRINKMLKPYLDNIKISETFAKIAKGIEETEEDIRIFKVAIVELGYPPHESIDIRKLRLIAQDYKINGKEHVEKYIDEFMIQFYDAKMIEGIGYNWNSKDFLKKRLPLLRNVIMAHKLGMYSLVVPSIISQFEGILIDAFDIKGHVNGSLQAILLEHLLKEKEFQSSFDFDDSIHEYYSNTILVSFKHGDEIASEISRHAILHGADTDFGKETTSLKVILLFDYFVNAIDKIKEETKEKCKTAVEEYRERGSSKRKKN
jgi:hypothetical protein